MLAGAYTPAPISPGHVPPPLTMRQVGSSLPHILLLHQTHQTTSTASPMCMDALRCIVLRPSHRPIITLRSATPTSTTSTSNRHTLNTSHNKTSILHFSNIINSNSSNHNKHNKHNSTTLHLRVMLLPPLKIWLLSTKGEHRPHTKHRKQFSTHRCCHRSSRAYQLPKVSLLQTRVPSCKQSPRVSRTVAFRRSISQRLSKLQILSD